MTVRELVALILDEAKLWAYAGHTQFFALFPELLLDRPLLILQVAICLQCSL